MITTQEKERKIKFVIIWERIANSGICEIFASSPKEAMEKSGLNFPDRILLTCYQVSGEAITNNGKRN